MTEILTGLGVAGIVAAIALASLFCLVQPIWAIVDCADSDREQETKILVGILIFFTWGVGSLIYGLFFARSSALRTFTVVVSLLMMLLVVGSVGSCVSAMSTASKHSAEQRAEAERRASEFVPAPARIDAVAPFHAILFARTGRHTSTALARFNLGGPVFDSARDVRGGVRHISHDPERGRTFALTAHAFGAISAETGEFTEIAPDPSFSFAWPKGLAWDPGQRVAVVVASHVYTEFFEYAPETATWSALPVKLRDVQVFGLAYLPDHERFYSLAAADEGPELRRLQRFNRSGADLGGVALNPPIPLYARSDLERAQLQHSSGRLVVLLPPHPASGSAPTDRIFLVDPVSGDVAGWSPGLSADASPAQAPASIE